ncbi:hypothetical protein METBISCDRAFT_27241 [Metschnikowia bicuspidata]|uniref:BOD1/SHG1 domain-containing protein n=1 Tax=Metschnikowia bicuspidata TaxID=27322 RepID=A0A4P9ZCQ9_9ASCO|nr:hypothetical protein METBISCDRAFT_27241 [Metschnikowia bicuspidata]
MDADSLDHKQLAAKYKKYGLFDKQRKELLENFKKSQTHTNLLLKLKVMVENKIKNDPSLLLKNRGQVAALIQGEVINGPKTGPSILSIVDKDINDKIIDSPQFHEELRRELKDVKRRLLGVSDEDYAKELEEEKNKTLAASASLPTLPPTPLPFVRPEPDPDHSFRGNFYKHGYGPKVVKPPRFQFNLPSRNRDRGSPSRGFDGHLSY